MKQPLTEKQLAVLGLMTIEELAVLGRVTMEPRSAWRPRTRQGRPGTSPWSGWRGRVSPRQRTVKGALSGHSVCTAEMSTSASHQTKGN
jgi:hypothetical protein